jgi:hypothetical protein
MVSRVFSSLGLATVLTIITLLVLQVAGAQVMSSPSYQLQSDSVNIGGGRSTSTNYTQESTVGEIATGPSESTSFNLFAGYQQMQSAFLSMSDPTNVIMTPELGGLTGGTSTGSTTVTVTTDNAAGYQMTIAAASAPAMQLVGGSDTIANYNDAGTTDFTFTFGATDALFGLTVTGVDSASAYTEDGASGCGGGGSVETLNCWAGASTTAQVIATGSGGNQPGGATTTIHFQVGIGGNASVPAGVYTATTTLTAYPL